jgi:hypothetical protein
MMIKPGCILIAAPRKKAGSASEPMGDPDVKDVEEIQTCRKGHDVFACTSSIAAWQLSASVRSIARSASCYDSGRYQIASASE